MSLIAPPSDIVQATLPELRAFLIKLLPTPVPESTRITSWWRDPRFNAQIGGHPESQHLVGLALDIVTSDPLLLAENLRRQDLVAIVETSHVHVQFWPAGVAGPLIRSLGLA